MLTTPTGGALSSWKHTFMHNALCNKLVGGGLSGGAGVLYTVRRVDRRRRLQTAANRHADLLIDIFPLFSLAPRRTATGRARVWSHVIDWGLVLVVAFGGTYPVVDVIRTNARSSWSFTSLALVLVLSFTLLCKWANDAVVLRDAASDNTSVP